MIINEYIYASNGSYIDVTVIGKNVSGGTVTATLSGTSYTATTDSNGKVLIPVDMTGTYSIAYANGDATGTATVNVSVLGFTYPVTVKSGLFKFSMDFDADVFMSDPTGCLTYSDDCTGFTPVSSPPSSLGTVQTIGSWAMSSDGTSSNKLLNGCFYATFRDNGDGLEFVEKLNPNDLTKRIELWNPSTQTWGANAGGSTITSYDTMFCIPTVYIDTSSDKISISNDSSDGTAYAHTIGGHVYDYLAIGVYPATSSSNLTRSISGAYCSTNTSRATFRSGATSRAVRNGHAMVWNVYQWQLWRMMTIFAMKSFNGQTQIGQGGYSYGPALNGTLMNAMGPFAGSTDTNYGSTNGVKAFIEDPWGRNFEFLDDVYGSSGGGYYIGQNAVPTDDTNNKTLMTGFDCSGGFANAILTSMPGWGLGTNKSGSTTTGLCDQQYSGASDGAIFMVGGYAGYVANGYAGPNYINAINSYTGTAIHRGSRLAFVFDL